jgi:hypothetical protein
MPWMRRERRYRSRYRRHEPRFFTDKVIGGEERHEGLRIAVDNMEQREQNPRSCLTVTRLDTARDARWYDLDVSCGWDAFPTHASHGTQVEVYLVEGHVSTWRKLWSDRRHTWHRADADAGGHTVWLVR